MGLSSVVKRTFQGEIGYELAPEHWRKGIMTEVVETIVHYGFEELGLHRIEAFVVPNHTASRKLLEKTGFTEEGILGGSDTIFRVSGLNEGTFSIIKLKLTGIFDREKR